MERDFMNPKISDLDVAALLLLRLGPLNGAIDELARISGLAGGEQLRRIMRGEEPLPLKNSVALASVCGIPAVTLAYSALAEAFPAAHAVLKETWGGELPMHERRLLEIYRACGVAGEIDLDLEASDRIAVALVHGFGGA
jgi:hypothetical protein